MSRIISIKLFVDSLRARFNNNGKGLVAERITWADMALRPFLRQFARCDWDWFLTSPYPLLRQWLIEFEAGDHLQRVMKKYRPWQADDEPLVLDWSVPA